MATSALRQHWLTCYTVLKYAVVVRILSYYPMSDFNLVLCNSYLHTEPYKF